MAASVERGAKGLREAGDAIRTHLECEAVLLTQGEEGMTLFQASRPPFPIPTRAKEVFDVTGAGDTVISTFTLAKVAGASLEEAAVIANAAAGCAVGKLGTAVVTREEIQIALQD
jgi:D-beta-D-heptose 7-phosphate kinase/D-beta-D-heptose 1-phosphate adenosyltransferase